MGLVKSSFIKVPPECTADVRKDENGVLVMDNADWYIHPSPGRASGRPIRPDCRTIVASADGRGLNRPRTRPPAPSYPPKPPETDLTCARIVWIDSGLLPIIRELCGCWSS